MDRVAKGFLAFLVMMTVIAAAGAFGALSLDMQDFRH